MFFRVNDCGVLGVKELTPVLLSGSCSARIWTCGSIATIARSAAAGETRFATGIVESMRQNNCSIENDGLGAIQRQGGSPQTCFHLTFGYFCIRVPYELVITDSTAFFGALLLGHVAAPVVGAKSVPPPPSQMFPRTKR
eukprot:673673-Amphidinium_carterae.1